MISRVQRRGDVDRAAVSRARVGEVDLTAQDAVDADRADVLRRTESRHVSGPLRPKEGATAPDLVVLDPELEETIEACVETDSATVDVVDQRAVQIDLAGDVREHASAGHQPGRPDRPAAAAARFAVADLRNEADVRAEPLVDMPVLPKTSRWVVFRDQLT